jgi:hypothetical protein
MFNAVIHFAFVDPDLSRVTEGAAEGGQDGNIPA